MPQAATMQAVHEQAAVFRNARYEQRLTALEARHAQLFLGLGELYQLQNAMAFQLATLIQSINAGTLPGEMPLPEGAVH